MLYIEYKFVVVPKRKKNIVDIQTTKCDSLLRALLRAVDVAPYSAQHKEQQHAMCLVHL